MPNPNWRVDTCHTPCKGDKTVACGGTNSINVYQWAPYSSEDSYEESPDYPEPSVSSDSSSSSDSSEEGPGLSVGTVDGARSKGCFRDSASDRVLVGHGFKSDNMSAQVGQRLISTFARNTYKKISARHTMTRVII